MGGYALRALELARKQQIVREAMSAVFFGSAPPIVNTAFSMNAANSVGTLQIRYEWDMKKCETGICSEAKNSKAQTAGITLITNNVRFCDQNVSSAMTSTYPGITTTRFSASGEFSVNSFNALFNFLTTGSPVRVTASNLLYVVDFRKETHGFVYGNPMSGLWSTLNCKNYYANQNVLDGTLAALSTTINSGNGVDITAKNGQTPIIHSSAPFQTEQQIVETVGANYKNFPIQDHTRMSDSMVDAFVTWVGALPSGAWVHFHCKSGKGRATTGSIMYDILRNYAQITDIYNAFDRQIAIGGKNFKSAFHFNDKAAKYGTCPAIWLNLHDSARNLFLHRFLNYTKTTTGGTIPWSTWCVQNPAENKCNGDPDFTISPTLDTVGTCYSTSSEDVLFVPGS